MSASTILPFLAGHRFKDPYKTKYYKDQAFVYKQNTCVGKNYI